MKKTKFFAIAASLLALGFLSCDSGIADDEKEAAKLTGADALKAYAEEIPSTDADLNGDASSTSVSAKWTKFTGTTIAAGTELKPTSGTGAKLVSNGTDTSVTDINKPVSATGVIKSGADSLTLATYDKTVKGKLLLTLEGDTNLVIEATGGSSDNGSKRFLVVEYDGEAVVKKGGMLSSTKNTFQIKNAPKGEYTIYFNGVTIISINADGTATKANGGTKDIELKEAVQSLAFKGDKNTDEEIEVKLNGESELVIYADDDENNDVTASASITVSAKENTPNAISFDSATSKVTGLSIGDKATIIARIGSVMKKQVFKVVAGEDKISPDTVELVAGATAETPVKQAFAITLGEEFITADGIAKFTKDADFKDYVTVGDGSKLTITKATVTTAATRAGLTVTVEGTTDATATTEAEKITFKLPKEILATNLAGEKPEDDVTVTVDYTTSTDLTLKLFNFTSSSDTYSEVASGTASDLIEISDVKFAFTEDDAGQLPTVDTLKNGGTMDKLAGGAKLISTSDEVTYNYKQNDYITAYCMFKITAKSNVKLSKFVSTVACGSNAKFKPVFYIAGTKVDTTSTNNNKTITGTATTTKELTKEQSLIVKVAIQTTETGHLSSKKGAAWYYGFCPIVITAEAAE